LERSGWRPYPNKFSLRSLTPVGTGEWKHQTLYQSGRVGFRRVKGIAAGCVVLESRPKFMIDGTKGDLPERLKWAEATIKPFTITVG
jgi:hypothetical protein